MLDRASHVPFAFGRVCRAVVRVRGILVCRGTPVVGLGRPLACGLCGGGRVRRAVGRLVRPAGRVRAPFAKLSYPLAGGLAAPARGEGTLRGRLARIVGLARNPIRAGLSALMIVMLVSHHLANHTNTGARR